ncbi:DnaJ domain-containing protein [Kordiimonas sp. SCSIO 12610]|uniref:DnaJ domain-containing protein n=1 Tax=Kordiimonas sp. SCSIO 12610 TaxID=2829597 RepID=UPI00210A6806|nr:DnaJ domain-containing protein [Kordiimonas sp. SCSIO 12610]UTW54275.1 DnaJ domain-containing protein [Kordiimonas sp. SCSIO 12610]
MIGWLLVGLLLALSLLWLLGWWSRTDVKTAKNTILWAIVFVCIALAAILVATGRGVFALAPIGYAAWRIFGQAMFAKNVYDKFSNRENRSGMHGTAKAHDLMSRAEALEVLGLNEGASEEDINAAYKKMMAKVHPDRGGNDWMAAKLNEAKRVLLNPKS